MTSDKNGYVVSFSAIAVAFDLAANYLFIKLYGVMGAAMAQCIYTFTLSWLSYTFLEWKYPQYRSHHNRLLGLMMVIPVFTCLIINIPYILFVEYLAIVLFAAMFILRNKLEMFSVIKD